MNKSRELALWFFSGLVVLGIFFFLKRGHLRKVEASTPIELFWRAESGEPISPNDIEKLTQQVSDTDVSNYPSLVALLLIHGRLPEGVPPMAYIERLRQMQTPCAKAYLGRLAWHTGQTEKAYAYWKEAAECPETALFLARTYLDKGQRDSACFFLRESLPLPSAAQRYQAQLRTRAQCP